MVDVWGVVNVRMSGLDNDVDCPCCGVALRFVELISHLYADHSPDDMVGSLAQFAYYDSTRHMFKS